MLFGYITGVLSLRFLQKIKDILLLKLGILVSLFSSILLCLNATFLSGISIYTNSELVLLFCFSFGYGFIVPCMFSMLSNNYKDVHFQGKLYGLIESGDNLSFVSAFFIGKLFIFLHFKNIFIFIASLLAFVTGELISSKFKGSGKLYGKVINQRH